ncbi:MAG TPA: aldo/keto reductase [Polyangiaceae bacterium]
MELRPFGPARVPVPRYGQGTWQMEADDRAGAVAALRAGLELGMTHIDTAELYGSGEVETIVAEAIAGWRDRIFLVSKVMPTNATKKGTLRACEATLKRLGTDHLDCYLLHWPGSHPLEGTIDAFEALQKDGKIRSYGVSNFDEDELEEAFALAGPGKIACNQVLYHLGERGIEHAVVPWCEAHEVSVVGYTPFGRSTFPPAPGRAVLEDIAERRGATARQVALAFLTRKPSLFAIPKASGLAHVLDNAGAAALELSAAELQAIDAAFPVGQRRRGVATL